MKHKASVVPAERHHIEVIARDTRQADIDELWASHRCTARQCMEYGMRNSISVWTGLIDDVPVCMFGVTPYNILQGIGVPWMVGSNGLNPLYAQKALLNHSRECLQIMQEKFPLLTNSVDSRNKAAQRWLKWMGFKFCEATKCGPDGVMFIPFYREL